MRPLIGITTNLRTVAAPEGEGRVHSLLMTYPTIVRAAGGSPVLLPAGAPEDAADLVERLDGVVFSGGGDIDPARYGGKAHPTVYGVEPVRDAFEFAFAAAAREARIPTLAICRGLQLMNVVHGGTLIEDIASESPDHLPHRIEGPGVFTPQHEVTITPGSAMAKALGTDRVQANSIHHQAVRDLGQGLTVVGRTSDGIVEALEVDDDSWTMLAVQWHPEYLGAGDAPSLRLFETLVEHSR